MNGDLRDDVARLQRELDTLRKEIYELREIVINLLNMVVGEDDDEFYDYT